MAPNTPAFDRSDPQAFAHSTKLMLAQSSSITFGPLASNLLPRSFGHLRLKQFQHLFSRPFGLKRSANCVSHVRAFVLAAVRSRAFGTSLVINVRSLALGLTCHSTARQPMCRAFIQSSRSTSHVARSLLLDNTPTRALQHSPLSLIDSRSFGLYRSTIHLYEHSSIGPFDPSDDQPIGLNNVRPLASVQHVTVDGQQKTERSTGYTPSGSCSPKNTQNINGLTNQVHERSTGYTPMGNCSPKNTQYIRDTLPWVTVRPRTPSTFGIHSTGNCSPKNTQYIRDTLPRRSSSRPFGLKGVRPLLSTARRSMCTSVQVFDRSTPLMLPFDLHDVRPLGFNHPASHATRPLPSVTSSIQLL
ncbi:hypothetical protein LR48_Vigan03g258400 [Vigna angularis]|uniref:Uncharacterized protein n=1 Tax=Phaseolus angularis TaxID=3914 RepID=A0A0L9U9C8_PHAAN|nr:hypothetical protein LR48_Vigan03g258400 [Vigna angularis]